MNAVPVLLVEDSPADARLFQAQLQGQPYAIEVAQRLSEAAALLAARRFSLLVVDLGLPDSKGVDTVSRVHELAPQCPILVLTGEQDEAVGLAAVQAGAQDFLTKGAASALLTRTMRYAIERKQAELLRARLVHADRLSSVGQLAASVAHEVNNPNAYVLGNLHILKEGVERWPLAPDDRAEALELIADCLDGVQRVTRIVRQLSNFARLDDHRLEPVAINDVLRDAVSLVDNELRHKAHLDVDLAPDLPRFHGSPQRLVQVFTNLLINAAQSFPEGKAEERWIRLTSRASGEALIVEVTDNGSGIAPEDIPRLTEPFFTTKPAGVGTGLGLAICAEILERHGASIVLDNRPDGGGAVARITIPVGSGATAAAPSGPRHFPELPQISPLRVLLIDDDAAVRRAFSRVISGAGHEVVAVSSGKEALAHLLDHDVDGILCDLEMPVMDGAAFFQLLERRTPRHAARVVFCTGGAFTPRAKSFLETSQAPLLQKPLDIGSLGEALTYWAGKRPAP